METTESGYKVVFGMRFPKGRILRYTQTISGVNQLSGEFINKKKQNKGKTQI
jgi:hypothetical protein